VQIIESKFVERWHLYGGVVEPVVATGEQIQYDRVIQIRDLPGPYFLRQMSFWDQGDKSIRCRNGRGEYFMSDFCPTRMLAGSTVPWPIWPGIEYAANSVFRYDTLQPDGEGLIDLWTILHGAHRVVATREQLYPERFEETPYTHEITINVTPNSTQKIPIYLFFNTPFSVRTLTGGIIRDNASDFETQVLLRDHHGQAFSNIALPWFTVFERDGARLPVTPSPELVIPAGSSYTLEVVGGPGTGDVTLQFNFGGALLNAV
jgi:hypothetical protein